uniref:Uncharacterized protein n=1 Tax=viral metagenome TaxID=1070528 RepID=A0A6M3LB13_9ZZZZ
MTYKDIVTKREFEVNGEKRVKWFKVGTLKETDDNKTFIELSMFPNTSFYVFEQKAKEDKAEESPF